MNTHMNNSFNISKYSFSQKGNEIYIDLGKTSDNLSKILIVPFSWKSNDFIIFPSNKSMALLRYEFFSKGKRHLKKEEFISTKDFPRIL